MAVPWDFYLELFCGAPQEVCNISLLAFAPILGSSPSRSKTIAGSVVLCVAGTFRFVHGQNHGFSQKFPTYNLHFHRMFHHFKGVNHGFPIIFNAIFQPTSLISGLAPLLATTRLNFICLALNCCLRSGRYMFEVRFWVASHIRGT
jgi:hypothetical protein